MQLTVRHVDTCLPCYVLDHCNGESEMLLGVPVDRASTLGDLMADLEREARDYGDKLPENIADADIKTAIADCFEGLNIRKAFDSSLEPSSDDDAESVYAWFRFSWIFN